MRTFILALALGIVTTDGGYIKAQGLRALDAATFEDKVRGGWAGQMIGVSYGAPTEFRYNARTIPTKDLPEWKPEKVENAINQDDLYVDMTFAEVMDRVGLDATTEQYGDAFRESKYPLWHANAAARRLLNRGIKAPWSGHPKYNVHANDIDFQIESDFIGLMTPGLPREARKYSDRVGRVMNFGDGLYGGFFVTGMYAAAFFEADPRRVVEQGLAMLPAESGYAQIIRDVLAWSAAHPGDWEKTWRLIEEKWDRDDSCPDGAVSPLNIDARLNGAYVALGLLYGGGDFAKTIDVTTRAGQDSDCNPSSAAGILGVMIGYQKIPTEWTAGIPALRQTKFAYTQYSFEDIVASTIRRAREVVTRAGGRVGPLRLEIPVQTPEPPPLEQWSMGTPDRLIDGRHSDWTWTGAWQQAPGRANRTETLGRETTAAGAAAELRFLGTGIALIGSRTAGGGTAEVHLDGVKMADLDAAFAERTTDPSLWHAYDLLPGLHTLRVVTTSPRHVGIFGAVTYQSPARPSVAASGAPAVVASGSASGVAPRSASGVASGSASGVASGSASGVASGFSRTVIETPTPFPLWPAGAPGALGSAPEDVPELTPYLAPAATRTGASIVVCPGGGYRALAMGHEGKPVAEWLNSLGVTAFVLKYRLGPRYHHPVQLHDAARALRTVRARAAEWGLDAARIGVLGFSAGGHLASTLATHFDEGNATAADPIERVSSRPDLAILGYPVITLEGPHAHAGSRRNLLGDNPSSDLIALLSNERQVTARTPPTFLVHTLGDAGVPYENSLLFAAALRKAGVPHELHVYEQGRHGLGLGGTDRAFASWPERCADWLRLRGFVR